MSDRKEVFGIQFSVEPITPVSFHANPRLVGTGLADLELAVLAFVNVSSFEQYVTEGENSVRGRTPIRV